MRKRNHTVTIRMNKEEYDLFQSKVKESGRTQQEVVIKAIALENNLATANKKDSTGICFIGERDFNEFLSKFLPSKEGLMKTMDGKVMGKHNGLMYYTIGQRQGLGIGGGGETGQPWFVIGKDLKTQTLYVGQGFENEYLFSNSLEASDVVFVNDMDEHFKCSAKFRYRQKDTNVEVFYDKENKKVKVLFENPVRGITPGQVVAFYKGEECLGSAIIDDAFYNGKKRKYI